MRLITVAVTFVILFSAMPAARGADEPPALSSNPFSRPPSAAIRTEHRDDGDEGSTSRLPLQATMVGRNNRLASVGGRILQRGDDYEGYRLLSIHERHAVFERNGQSMIVYVRPEQTDDDADRRR